MDSLVDRLQALPLILAGPILRRVTASSVTVWVVLKNAATVSPQIGDAVARTPVGSAATQPTIAGRARPHGEDLDRTPGRARHDEPQGSHLADRAGP